MFVKLPSRGMIFDARKVRKLSRYNEDLWSLTVDLGSIVEPSFQRTYIDNEDYDYLWEQLQKLNGGLLT